jgi:hypothetical protein
VIEPIPPIFEQPVFVLGPFDVFASMAELRKGLGPLEGEFNERMMGLGLLVGSRRLLHELGYAFTDTELPPDPDPLPIVPVACRASWRRATVVEAVRFLKSEEVPFGVAGGWDMATYVRQSIPDVDMLILGERVAFGIA